MNSDMGQRENVNFAVFVVSGFLVIFMFLALLPGCGDTGDSPEDIVSRFLEAWEQQNWDEYKATIAPERTKLNKEMMELAKAEFNNKKVKFSGLKMKTTYDDKDGNRAVVTLTGGKGMWRAPVASKEITELQDIGKMKDEEKPAVPTVKVEGKWYVDLPLSSYSF